jgi:hypothetical protein
MRNAKTKTRFLIALGGTATLAAASWLAGGGVSYASGGPGAVCDVPSRYPTIQAAVGTTTCSTIRVAPGTYAENVSIGRSLTLDGAQAGRDARGRRGGESVLNGGTQANITITADNVTVDGFTLNGPPGGGTAALVMQTGNSGETVQNNIVNNPGRAASITTSRTTFRTNVVNNTSTASDGFQANSTPVHDVTISSNSFSGANPTVYNADVTFIEGNANVTVADNKSTGDGTLVALFKTAGARVSGNTVVGAGASSAVYVGGADRGVSVTDNTISSAGSAVKVANSFGDGLSSGVVISRNTLRNNQYGVNVASASTSDAVQATRNSLTGNTLYGVFADPAAGPVTNATCNWWGALTGPGPVGPGRGDKVSGNVTYRPWLKLSSLILGCN